MVLEFEDLGRDNSSEKKEGTNKKSYIERKILFYIEEGTKGGKQRDDSKISKLGG